MLFMVIERFKDQDAIPVYRRVRDKGIKFPEGLKYVGSWIEPNFDRCFQLMECDDLRLLQEWVLNCHGLGMTFEIVPVVPFQPLGQLRAAGRAGPVHFGAVAGGQDHRFGNPVFLAQGPQRGDQPVLAERHLFAQRNGCGLMVDTEDIECHGGAYLFISL